MIRLVTTWLLLSAALPSAAEGWRAKQREQVSAQGNKPVVTEISYRDGKLRIDQGQISSLFDLRSGRLTVLNHQEKSFITDTFEELAKVRDTLITNTRRQLPTLPPELKKDLEAKLKEYERRDLGLPKATGKKLTVGAFSCEEYRAQSTGNDTTLCVAKDVGVNLADFAKHGTAVAARLHKLRMGGSEGPGGAALFEVAKYGFPVKSSSKVTLSGQVFTTETELLEITASEVAPSEFEVPKGYQAKKLPDLQPPAAMPR